MYNFYTRNYVSQVELLQARLKSLGYNPGKEDGIIGFYSDKAIKKMQASFGLKPDGIIGPSTRALLNTQCN